MTSARGRRWLIVATVAVLMIAGIATYVAVRSRDDSTAARTVAEHYLELLADETMDPDGLEAVISTDDTSTLDSAGALLATTRMRISEAVLGESEEITTADRAGTLSVERDQRFDRFERFEVSYRLGGEHHSATITLGLPASGTDADWLVVTPLSGQVDWNSATWGQSLLDLTVGDLEVTDPDRTTYEPDAQFVHPGVYPVSASVGRLFTAAAVELTVPAGGEVTPVPEFDLQPTPAGAAAIMKKVLAAFEPCERGTAYCPVLALVQPRNSDLPDGWWRGLVAKPTIGLDGTDVTLRDGKFRYLGPSGLQTVAFEGSTSVRIDPISRRLDLAGPLRITRP